MVVRGASVDEPMRGRVGGGPRTCAAHMSVRALASRERLPKARAASALASGLGWSSTGTSARTRRSGEASSWLAPLSPLVRVSVRVRVRVRVRVIGFPNPNLEQQVLAVDREGQEVIHT